VPVLLAAVVAGGCAGGATFTSTDPPPETTADAWFIASQPRVRNAAARAMQEHGFALDPDGGPALVVGTKAQRPADGQASSEKSPTYLLRIVITREGDTHARATVLPECALCDGSREFEWEYPADVLRGVLERTRDLVGERRARLVLPPRHRPHARRVAPRYR
jgi:hypothetical protein